jgi:putative Holliday junction resolvase
MRILGIDYGTKRIGLALSDETKNFSREFDILAPKIFWQSIADIIAENEVSEIVLGLPLNMTGGDTPITLEAREFKEKLAATVNLPIHFMDERLSSSMARGISASNQAIDSLAAQIILQNFLDRQQNIN